ncbi:protein FAM124A-like [Ruditapes philippinarum]|uniref:protein FAM124A-like n=1 Tax=Ruditapes philippinarum TaxID=129788 RepID=UPI00295B8EA4|nr:protein FAM124A-like [Ruditapes philippinarum]
MSENPMESESGNAYGLRLTLLAPEGRGTALDRILSSLTDWIDPAKQIVDVDEMPPEEDKRKQTKHEKSIDGCLITPAISVMLFVRETGRMCLDDVEKVLKKSPWQFHHKVELHNKNVPRTPLAKQEFYKLADDLPLFAACPVLNENEHLRVNLYVHNFPAMVEFYRTITDTEIETNKPEFCVFELYRQPGLDIQLSLKRSQYIYPIPVESAYVSFNIKNIKVVELVSDNEVEHVGGNVYTTRDPDGNLVVLYETDFNSSHDCSNLAGACNALNTFSLDSCTGFDDVKSLKSTAGSHDSGRYSDLDGPNNDNLVHTERSKRSENKRKSRNQSEKSEGYASSSSSSLTLRHENSSENSTINDKNQKSTGKHNGKSSKNKASASERKTKHGKQITPVYI